MVLERRFHDRGLKPSTLTMYKLTKTFSLAPARQRKHPISNFAEGSYQLAQGNTSLVPLDRNGAIISVSGDRVLRVLPLRVLEPAPSVVGRDS
jgi:hypothetical protein